ncbi:MAG: hypothetical protein KKC79_13180 [Gammaproteobacteria bacterium]|nr:hypothetical protein [Gammaproteobacteria bacterium]MBU1444248.1 hypothetical protein [Gammaproteobacteria bacterium]MBU2288020.1 hypothetical protein [Gammaproteobacteria bacterium]MBU2409585.1 hypothetical protein [Gammaproteobacteria bacterium]
MKKLSPLFAVVHGLMALLFACAALVLVGIASYQGWLAVSEGFGRETAEAIIEAIGLLAAAVVALQISQTVIEEEVIREAHISAPTRVRRFLSRFMVVIVVAIAVEGLVATFRSHEDPSQMIYAAALMGSVALVMIGWGAFIWLNRAAEELEPEAMADAKQEDEKMG